MDIRGIRDRLRLYSGLVMLLYVVGHLSNHVLGLISLDALNAGIVVTIEPWRTLPGTILLAAAVVVHVGMSLWSLYARRTLRLPTWLLAQTITGLLIPGVLGGHVMATRFFVELFDVEHSYTVELYILWVALPRYGVSEALLLLVVWLHACIGLHMWLRLKPWYAASQQLAFAIALLLPALALAGFVSGGMEVRTLAAQEGWVKEMWAAAQFSKVPEGWFWKWEFRGNVGFLALIATLFLARGFRAHQTSRQTTRSDPPRLYYPDCDPIEISPGMTVLEALRAAQIPHASVCGGRGRCSTCRVLVGAGGEALHPQSAIERQGLLRISDLDARSSSVRLACQIRPGRDLHVTPLLPPTAGAGESWQRASHVRRDERSP